MKRTGLLLLVLLAGAVCSAQTGSVRGRVVYHLTGMPKFSPATVTALPCGKSAATDEQGRFELTGIPAGRISLRAASPGYESSVTEPFLLQADEIAVAEIPLSQCEGLIVPVAAPVLDSLSADWEYRISGEELRRLPIRGVAAAVAIMPGVINNNGTLYVMGGRSDQTTWMVDGVNTSDVFGGSSMTTVISDAIETVRLHAGGYSAAYGGRMSGIVEAVTKTGGSDYHFSLDAVSDDVWAFRDRAGSYEILGIDKLYSRGYNNYTLTASGPIIPRDDRIRFFVAAEHNWTDSPPSWFEGFSQDSIQATSVSNYRVNSQLYNQRIADGLPTRLLDTTWIAYDVPPGRVPGGWVSRNTINSNIVFDFQPIRVQAGFNYNETDSRPQSTAPNRLATNNESYTQKTRPRQYLAYLKLTHTVDPTLFYTIQGSWGRTSNEWGPRGLDWDFSKSNFTMGDSGYYDEMFASWSDPANFNGMLDRDIGYGNFYLPYTSDWSFPHYIIDDDLPGGTVFPANTYGRNNEDKWTFKLDLQKQFGTAHEVSLGGEYSESVYRTYFLDIGNYYWAKRSYDIDPSRLTEYDFWNNLTTYRGCDVYGNPVNKDQIVSTKQGLENAVDINIRNAPARPWNTSFYINDKIRLKELTIDAGLRYEHMNWGHYSWARLDSLTHQTGGVVADEHFQDPKEYEYFLPRIGFSFPVTDQTVVTAHYGEYVQRPSLTLTLTDETYQSQFFQLYGGLYFDPWPNVNMKPERTSEYTFGVTMKFRPAAVFNLSAYYRTQEDLIGLRHLIPVIRDYKTQTIYWNMDFATIKGVTATFDLRRTSRISARVNYTYQIAEGTGSVPDSHHMIAWMEADPRFPESIYPLDFDQRHSGSAIVDIRTLADDGPELFGAHPLQNMGLNLLFIFHSGSPFTRIPQGDAFSSLQGFNAPPPLEYPNSARLPWVWQLDGRLEKQFTVGPLQLIAYLEGINILNLKSYDGVFRQTGRPDTDGWLETDAGKAYLEAKGEYAAEYERWYYAILTGCGSFGYQPPRQLRLGVRVEL
ncbi:TonB-dependent receptor [bacterium]|nr:TonB-dependent receptor [bacterium]